MANKGFNKSTVTFGTAIANIRGISFDQAAPEVSVHASTWAKQSFRSGIPKNSLTVDVVGGSTITTGTTGALTISFFDGVATGSTAATPAVCLGRSIKGSMNSEITTTLRFARTA